jgi:hypothetical protein
MSTIKLKKIKQSNEFDFHVDRGIKWALARIKMNFEHSPNARYHLPYHDSAHTLFVIKKVEVILDSICSADLRLVSKRDIQIGRFAAAFHDVFIRWEKSIVKEGQYTKILRKRLLPDSIENEKASAEIALNYMDMVNEVYQTEIFTSRDKALVKEAIEVTLPKFDPNIDTVIQPRLTKDSSLVALAVALADVGAAGLDSKVFTDGGDRLFREENIDIFEAIELNNKKISKDTLDYYAGRMRKWSQSQIGFAKGRKIRSQTEIQVLPPIARDKVLSLFNNFDNSIEIAQKLLDERSRMDFIDLINDMGYL